MCSIDSGRSPLRPSMDHPRRLPFGGCCLSTDPTPTRKPLSAGRCLRVHWRFQGGQERSGFKCLEKRRGVQWRAADLRAQPREVRAHVATPATLRLETGTNYIGGPRGRQSNQLQDMGRCLCLFCGMIFELIAWAGKLNGIWRAPLDAREAEEVAEGGSESSQGLSSKIRLYLRRPS